MDKKKFSLILGQKTKSWVTVFNGTNSSIACGTEASIDDLHDNDFTVEGWFGVNYKAAAQQLITKSQGALEGWRLQVGSTGIITAGVRCATTDAEAANVGVIVNDGLIRHYAFTFSDAGDRKVRLYLNGTLIATSTAGDGAIVSDATRNLTIGSAQSIGFLTGKVGWVRISNNIRYSADFTPISRNKYPVVDANTIRLFKMDEGTGTTITDYSANAQNATLANGTWIKT